MATSINELAQKLQYLVSWQETPVEMTFEDYLVFTKMGFEEMIIDTGRATDFNRSSFYTEQDEEGNIIEMNSYDLLIDEEAYVVLCAQIHFFRRVQTDVNEMVSYTTDALSVTQGDKPYANLQNTIKDLMEDKRRLFHKMRRYSIL